MKISYIHGPGDAFRTFLHWQRQSTDNSLIKQTYSGQFFDLVAELGAKGQVICVTPVGVSCDDRFSFVEVKRQSSAGLQYHIEEYKYAAAISRILSEYQADVVIISSDFPLHMAGLLPRRPVKILTLHNTFWQPYGRPSGLKEIVLNFARKISLRHVDMAVCVSAECQRQFSDIRRGAPVFSVIQIPRLTNRCAVQKTTPPRHILYVGRVEIVKGVQDLVHAFDIVRHRVPDARLTIVGDGDALELMNGLVSRLGLDGLVELTGRLDADGVGQSYAGADLCVCPTQWRFNEGLATVPLEAASYGVPTIMSRAVPAKEQFGSDAIIFDPGNVSDLAEKMLLALTDEAAYRNAQRDACESFARTMRDIGDWKQAVSACLNRIGNNGQSLVGP